jgi:hypothetical protein
MPKKDFTLFELSEFVKSRQLRGAQSSPKDQMPWASFFWFVFLDEQKNEQVKEICWQRQVTLALLKDEGINFRINNERERLLYGTKDINFIRLPPIDRRATLLNVWPCS